VLPFSISAFWVSGAPLFDQRLHSYRFELETNLDEIAELAFYGELSDLVVES
jgi:hypothetical protein